MSSVYHVIVQGTKPGMTTDEVVGSLAQLFRVSADRLRVLFEAPSFVISPQRGVDLRTAQDYRNALDERGCVCVVRPA